VYRANYSLTIEDTQIYQRYDMRAESPILPVDLGAFGQPSKNLLLKICSYVRPVSVTDHVEVKNLWRTFQVVGSCADCGGSPHKLLLAKLENLLPIDFGEGNKLSRKATASLH
jgi:hypothetical protein